MRSGVSILRQLSCADLLTLAVALSVTHTLHEAAPNPHGHVVHDLHVLQHVDFLTAQGNFLLHLAAFREPWSLQTMPPALALSHAVDDSPASSFRLSSLVEGVTGSVTSRFNNLWASAQPLISPRSNLEASGPRIVAHTAQLIGPDANTSTLQRPLQQRATKSASSNISLTSQPVLVRAYTYANRSLPTSAIPHDIGAPQSMTAAANLPSVDSFSFDGILRAIEPDIHDAIDGIAEIYARSKLSLADDYDAHLSPQGQAAAPRMRYSGLAIRTVGLERTLTTVTEASSSSERLVGGSKAASVASGKGKATAYGSLRSIISRGRSSSHSSAPPETPIRPRLVPSAWTVAGENEPFITLRRQNTAPMHLSLASVAEVPRDKTVRVSTDAGVNDHRNTSTQRRPWIGWTRSWTGIVGEERPPRRLDAEGTLKSVLDSVAQHSEDRR